MPAGKPFQFLGFPFALELANPTGIALEGKVLKRFVDLFTVNPGGDNERFQVSNGALTQALRFSLFALAKVSRRLTGLPSCSLIHWQASLSNQAPSSIQWSSVS